ncbi:hypothetical protein [Ekhidna sp.]|uniref:hypothetical protein n=1 Tax=Ekhidna sp. TaxID=2608089 RepID=UPI0032F06B08
MIELFSILGYIIVPLSIIYLIVVSPFYFLIFKDFDKKIPQNKFLIRAEFDLIQQKIDRITTTFSSAIVEGKNVSVEHIDTEKRNMLRQFNRKTFLKIKKNISKMSLEEVNNVATYIRQCQQNAEVHLSQRNPLKMQSNAWILYLKYYNHALNLLVNRKHFLSFRGYLSDRAIKILDNYKKAGILLGEKETYQYHKFRESQSYIASLLRYIWDNKLVNKEGFYHNREKYFYEFFEFINYYSESQYENWDNQAKNRNNIPDNHLSVLIDGKLLNPLK